MNLFSSYVLFDSRTMGLNLRRLDFNIDDYEMKFTERGIALPGWFERQKRSHGSRPDIGLGKSERV